MRDILVSDFQLFTLEILFVQNFVKFEAQTMFSMYVLTQKLTVKKSGWAPFFKKMGKNFSAMHPHMKCFVKEWSIILELIKDWVTKLVKSDDLVQSDQKISVQYQKLKKKTLSIFLLDIILEREICWYPLSDSKNVITGDPYLAWILVLRKIHAIQICSFMIMSWHLS